MVRRVGVSIGIPEPWGSELWSWRGRVGDPLACSVPPHVTLLPPTDLDDADMDQAEEHLSKVAAAHDPFELHLRGTGTFRPVSDVVFVVVATGISECEMLERDVRSGLLDRPLRFPYHPHVTVGHDLSPEALDEAYDGLADFEARFEVWGFSLFEHGGDGVWRPQRDFPFAGAKVGPLRRPRTTG